MNKILFHLYGDKKLGENLAKNLKIPLGEYILRRFADDESYLQILTNVKDAEVILLSSLEKPDHKILPMLFFAKTLKEFGAKKVVLLTPYLAYMRQDIRFNEGEAITSACFAEIVSNYFDELVTIDPHLHRYNSLDEIYTLKSTVLHATSVIGKWVKENIKKPILVGPDEESAQWVETVAKDFDMPSLVLTKERFGDRDVKVSIPNFEKYQDHNPILIDDIISTGRTMIETCNHIIKQGMRQPICIGVHGIFVDEAYKELQQVSQEIITCNTITHVSNKIDVTDLITKELDK